ncbi:MAG TPA: hypothetical protein VI756_00910 [Blastocatellia bacterium]
MLADKDRSAAATKGRIGNISVSMLLLAIGLGTPAFGQSIRIGPSTYTSCEVMTRDQVLQNLRWICATRQSELSPVSVDQ